MLEDLLTHPRLLIEADLAPVQGTRFQPTGFPDLGAATYQLADRTAMLLLESAQSVANRLEETIWDKAAGDVVEPLRGISYVAVKRGDAVLTNSLLESHRLNSYYILEGKDKQFFERIKSELASEADSPVNYYQLAKVLAKYDINCLLHGIFLSKKELAGGRFKLARALSGFIEARNVSAVSSGGVKIDRVNPSGESEKGAGNVPFHRDEYTAEKITAYFSLDLAQIRSYRLGDAVEQLLAGLAIWKIQRFLERGLRLRTACDFDCLEIKVTRPNAFKLPDHRELTQKLRQLVKAASPVFADPPVTVVQFAPPEKKESKSKKKGSQESEEDSDED